MLHSEHTTYSNARPDSRLDRYTIRYRCRKPTGDVALLVEDSRGTIYLYASGTLQLRWIERAARTRLGHLVASDRSWLPVPSVAPYSIEELHDLTGAQEQ